MAIEQEMTQDDSKEPAIEATLFEVQYTGRGFEYIEIPSYDKKGEKVGLVQASSAIGNYDDSMGWPGSSYLWIGEGTNRPHLDREDVAGLVRHLQNWLETGSLKIEEEGAANDA